MLVNFAGIVHKYARKETSGNDVLLPKCVFSAVCDIEKSIFILLFVIDARHYSSCKHTLIYKSSPVDSYYHRK